MYTHSPTHTTNAIIKKPAIKIECGLEAPASSTGSLISCGFASIA